MLIGRSIAVDDTPSPGVTTYFAPYMLQQPGFAPLQPRARLTDFPLKLEWKGGARVTLMGGFGVRLGDTILGLQAAHVLRKKARRPVAFHCHIVKDPRHSFAETYEFFDGMTTAFLPLTAPHRPDIDADLCDLFYREEFSLITLQDLFFDLLGMDWRAIPDGDKKPYWLAEKIRPDAGSEGVIWLVPASSDPLRSFSDDLVRELSSLHPAIRLMPRCATLKEYTEKIAGARALICTDTSAYHVAAAWDRPSCVVFGKVRIVQEGYEQIHDAPAQSRMCYYPAVKAVEFPGSDAPGAERDARIVAAVREWLRDI
jgi:hypothetical protein